MAKTFAAIAKMSEHEALNEASVILHSDGLFHDELFMFDNDTGELHVDFRTTFARGMQNNGRNNLLFSICDTHIRYLVANDAIVYVGKVRESSIGE